MSTLETAEQERNTCIYKQGGQKAYFKDTLKMSQSLG